MHGANMKKKILSFILLARLLLRRRFSTQYKSGGTHGPGTLYTVTHVQVTRCAPSRHQNEQQILIQHCACWDRMIARTKHWVAEHYNFKTMFVKSSRMTFTLSLNDTGQMN